MHRRKNENNQIKLKNKKVHKYIKVNNTKT